MGLDDDVGDETKFISLRIVGRTIARLGGGGGGRGEETKRRKSRGIKRSIIESIVTRVRGFLAGRNDRA